MASEEVSILVVEDVEADITRICDLLRVRGDTFDVARTVPEAIYLLSQKRYRKVWLDVVIAGNVNGGRLVLEALKTRNPDCRVLIVSASGETAAVQRLRADALVEGVITKTMMMDLVSVISRFLDAPQGNGQLARSTNTDARDSEAEVSEQEREGISDDGVERQAARAIGPLAYIAMTGVGLVIGIAMLFALVWFSSRMPADSTVDRIYYVILVVVGFAGAAFLFGVMRSYASFRGRLLSGTLQLGGPAAVAALIVVGGFILAPRNGTFSVTVRITDDRGHQARVGVVTLRAQAATMSAPINSNGEADFRELPAKLHATRAKIVADVPGYEQQQTEYELDSVVVVVLRRQVGR